ncbi:VanZ family protein [Treponema sp. OMZ 305]|uniref:VanZ family protein n=1 Tax=Treponema TaxID=157 RepID=UPI001BAF537E|nr:MULTISPECIES: VanZ family protein [Treponema]QUY18792.1 VanZ family protein [Treponema vincentii]UTC58687.1 VanZ family protein [Treponema sp. OMZ 305]
MISKKIIEYTMRCMSMCIAVVIFLLSAQSKLPIPESVSFHGLDKLLHACAFGSLAFTLSYWFASGKWLAKPFKYFTLVCLFTACYGISDEIHQIFVPGRDASVYDWFADCTGAVLATLVRLGMLKHRLEF